MNVYEDTPSMVPIHSRSISEDLLLRRSHVQERIVVILNTSIFINTIIVYSHFYIGTTAIIGIAIHEGFLHLQFPHLKLPKQCEGIATGIARRLHHIRQFIAIQSFVILIAFFKCYLYIFTIWCFHICCCPIHISLSINQTLRIYLYKCDLFPVETFIESVNGDSVSFRCIRLIIWNWFCHSFLWDFREELSIDWPFRALIDNATKWQWMGSSASSGRLGKAKSSRRVWTTTKCFV